MQSKEIYLENRIITANGSRLAEVAGFIALSYQLATKIKCMQPSLNLQLTRQFWQTAVSGCGSF